MPFQPLTDPCLLRYGIKVLLLQPVVVIADLFWLVMLQTDVLFSNGDYKRLAVLKLQVLRFNFSDEIIWKNWNYWVCLWKHDTASSPGVFQAAIGFTTLQNLDNTLASVNNLTNYTSSTLTADVNNGIVSQNISGQLNGFNTQRYFRWTPNLPNAPVTFSFTDVTQLSTTLNWNDSSANEIGFTVYRSDDSGNYIIL